MPVLDARTFPDQHQVESDICIIGAGAAGLTIANEFIQTSLRVVLLESGGLEVAEDVQVSTAEKAQVSHTVISPRPITDASVARPANGAEVLYRFSPSISKRDRTYPLAGGHSGSSIWFRSTSVLESS